MIARFRFCFANNVIPPLPQNKNNKHVMSEEEAWKKRAEEAKEAGTSQHGGGWRWSLNWNSIEGTDIIVGSCPRSPDDVVRTLPSICPRL